MYGRPPYLRCLSRWVLPGLIIFYLGVVVMGAFVRSASVSTREAFQPMPIKSFGNPENATEEPADSPLSAAWQH